MRRGGVGLVVAVVAATFFVGCQLEESEPATPTGPSEAPTSTSTPAGPTPVLGSAPAAPAPTPSPDPGTPDPASSPAPPPASGSCDLPPSNPTNPICTDASPWLEDEVEAALDTVVERFPELFDFNDTRCGNCYFVKDTSRYYDEVIKQLNRQGLCTDGVREELGIKSSNEASEQYDILLASDHMRRAPSSYRGVCRPAIF